MSGLLDRVRSLFSKFRLPKLTLPKIRLPKLNLPKFSLPKLNLKLPKLSLPKLNLSRVSNGAKAYLGKIGVAFRSLFSGKGLLFLLIAVVLVSAVGVAGYGVGEQQLKLEGFKFGSPSTTENLTVNSNKLNVRPCAGTDCQAIGSLANGESVQVLERVVNDVGDEWCKISYQGADAYVACKYLVAEEGEQ